MSNTGLIAPPTSRRELRKAAHRLRRGLGMEEDHWFPIIEVLELALSDILPGFQFDVWSKKEMGQDHGLTLIDEGLVVLRQDVYEGAVEGRGRDRFTAGHELGHAIFHSSVGLARSNPCRPVRPFEDPEWQANTFAAELLIFSELVAPADTIVKVAANFGVSEDAARVQLNVLRKEGLV